MKEAKSLPCRTMLSVNFTRTHITSYRSNLLQSDSTGTTQYIQYFIFDNRNKYKRTHIFTGF